HEMNVVQKICDYVYVMEDGAIIEDGTTIDLFTRPKNPTTKMFLNTISQRKISDSLLEELTEAGTVIRLTFVGHATGEPLLASVTEKFSAKPNILSANIIELKNGIVGNIVVHLEGSRIENIDVLRYLTEEGVLVEELNRIQ